MWKSKKKFFNKTNEFCEINDELETLMTDYNGGITFELDEKILWWYILQLQVMQAIMCEF